MEIYKKYINESMMLSGKRHVGFAGIDEIGKFYLVTKGSPNSTEEDVISRMDVFDLYLQLKGGLKGLEIVGLYKDE